MAEVRLTGVGGVAAEAHLLVEALEKITGGGGVQAFPAGSSRGGPAGLARSRSCGHHTHLSPHGLAGLGRVGYSPDASPRIPPSTRQGAHPRDEVAVEGEGQVDLAVGEDRNHARMGRRGRIAGGRAGPRIGSHAKDRRVRRRAGPCRDRPPGRAARRARLAYPSPWRCGASRRLRAYWPRQQERPRCPPSWAWVHAAPCAPK